MLPARYAPALFGLILSGLMTLRAAGPGADWLPLWIGAWLTAWLLAFPVVLVVAPLTRRIVQRMVRPA